MSPEEKLASFLQPSILPELAIAVSIVAATFSAITATGVIWNVFVTRKTARQQATLEFLEKHASDKVFQAARILPDLKEKKYTLRDVNNDPALGVVIFLLNRLEQLAVGLNHKVYDEDMIFDALALQTIKAYEYCEFLIMEIRNKPEYRENSHLKKPYSALENLANDFKSRFSKKCGITMPMSGEITAKDAKDHLIKHLEMIQGVVNRLAHCSFLIKGWSMTILAAVVVFLARSGIDNPNILLAFLAPIIGFWFLDAYYLWQERLFRGAYDKICDSKHTDFAMPKRKVKLDREYLSSLFSSTVVLFYAIEFIFLAAVFFILS